MNFARALMRTLYVTSERQSRVNIASRWLQLSVLGDIDAFEIASPIGSMTSKTKVHLRANYTNTFGVSISFFATENIRPDSSPVKRIAKICEYDVCAYLFYLRDESMLFPRVFPLCKLLLCAQDILHDKSMRMKILVS